MKNLQKEYSFTVLSDYLSYGNVPRKLRISPRSWVRIIREALGMTTSQLAERLSVSQSSVAQLEKREADGAVTLAHLRKAADALDCDLVYYLMPRTSLEQMVESRSLEHAARQFGRVSHSMKLEDQSVGKKESEMQVKSLAKQLQNNRSARIWDKE